MTSARGKKLVGRDKLHLSKSGDTLGLWEPYYPKIDSSTGTSLCFVAASLAGDSGTGDYLAIVPKSPSYPEK